MSSRQVTSGKYTGPLPTRANGRPIAALLLARIRPADDSQQPATASRPASTAIVVASMSLMVLASTVERGMRSSRNDQDRIEAFQHAGRGEVIVRKVGRGYSLFSADTGAPIARLRPTGEADMVQVLWWSGERSDASGPFTHDGHGG